MRKLYTLLYLETYKSELKSKQLFSKLVTKILVLVCFIFISAQQNINTQTQFVVPVTLINATASTALTCGSTSAGGSYNSATTCSSRDDAFNASGLTIRIPAVLGLADLESIQPLAKLNNFLISKIIA